MARHPESRARQIALLDLVPHTQGWLPVKHLVSLLQDYLDADPVPAPEARPTLTRRLRFKMTRSRGGAGEPHLLVVAPRLEYLTRIAALPEWRRFGRISAWLIDSFWTDALSQASGLQNIDHLFITWGGDLDTYRAAARGTVDWLPWGTDAFGLGSADPGRNVDVLRLGRQPAIWENDMVSAARVGAAGMTFAGRPDGGSDADSYAALLRSHLSQAKTVLAHSNLVDDATYTHPLKEYMTARWTDAFACGCMVVGAQPIGDPLFARVSDEAVLHLDPGTKDGGMEDIAAALRNWAPARAQAIHEMALREFDWRWRIRDIARRLELPTSRIDADLGQIERRLARSGSQTTS